MNSKLHVHVIVILLLASFNVHSQFKIKGVVRSEKDNNPISFVAIGMFNTIIGTISEQDGSFYLEIPKKLKDKELIFSALGFERQTIILTTVTSDTVMIVVLKEKIIELEEVTVKSRSKFRRFEFGNKEFDGGSIYAHAESAGSAMVMLVDNSNPHFPTFQFPAFLGKVSLRIVNNTFKEFKLRLRLYAVDSVTGKPAKDLLNKDILVIEKLRNGWVEVDLSSHNITVNAPFYIGFEWILDAKDRAFLHKQYSDWYRKHPDAITQESARIGSNPVQYANLNGAFWAGTSFGTSSNPNVIPKFKCYYRFNSFGEWFVSPVALCLKVVALI